MDSNIEEIKRKIDLVSLISEYASLKKAGRNYRALCPFHQEKTPSFMVSPDLQIFKCFGCGRGGDCFAFIKESEGVEFGEALKRLAKRAGVELKEFKNDHREEKRELLYKLNGIAAEIYHHLLLNTPAGKQALEYLKGRGLTDKSIKDFKLGVAPSTRNLIWQYLGKKGFALQDVLDSGLVIKSGDVRDRFFSRIMFPIFDIQGRVIAFSGRILGSGEPKYLNSPDSLTFNKSLTLYGIDLAKGEIKKEKKAILVEGNLDVISSHQVGVRNVVAPLGTSLSSQQLLILKKFAPETDLCFDGDAAGDAATRRSIEIAENAGLDIKIIRLLEGKDPDECIKKSPDLWRESINQAMPVYDFLLFSAQKRYDLNQADGKRKLGQELLPVIGRIQDDFMKAHYVQKIAAVLNVGEETVLKALEKYQTKTLNQEEIKEAVKDERGDRHKLLEHYLLSLALQGKIKVDLPEESFSEGPDKEIAHILNKNPDFQLAQLYEKIPESLEEAFSEITLLQIDEKIVEDEELLKKEVEGCKHTLYQVVLRENLASLSLKIKQAELAKDSEKVSLLTKEFKDLTEKLRQLESVELGLAN